MWTRDSTHSSPIVNQPYGSRMNQRNTSEVCVHAHSLSTESGAVSFEYDNRAWKTVPVSGHLLKTEACLLKQACACSTVQPVEQDSKQS